MATLEERLKQAQESDIGSIQQRLEKVKALDLESASTAFGLSVGRSVLDLIFESPKALAFGAAGIQAPFSERGFSEIFEEEKKKFPANLAFDTNEFGAFARSLPELLPQRPVDQPGVENPVLPFTERFSGRFDEELAKLNAEEAAQQEKHPFATGAGDFVGNVMGIMLGRIPFLSRIEKAESFLAGKKFADAIRNPGIFGELGNVVKKIVDSKAMRSLMRGTGRAGEAGLEAAALEAINGDDPLRAAAYVAGGQALGSAMINISKGIVDVRKPLSTGGKLALMAGAYFGILQTMKAGTPIDDDPIDTVIESFQHVALLIAAGGVATALGAGRIRRSEAEALPRLAEFVSTLPRATMISLATNYINASPDEQQTIDATLQQLQQDPGFFGPEISDKLLKAFESGNLTKALREEL